MTEILEEKAWARPFALGPQHLDNLQWVFMEVLGEGLLGGNGDRVGCLLVGRISAVG